MGKSQKSREGEKKREEKKGKKERRAAVAAAATPVRYSRDNEAAE